MKKLKNENKKKEPTKFAEISLSVASIFCYDLCQWCSQISMGMDEIEINLSHNQPILYFKTDTFVSLFLYLSIEAKKKTKKDL